MCGRFTLSVPPHAVAELFGLPEPPDLFPRYNIAPTQQVAAVRDGEEGRTLSMLRWGLIPSWSGPDGGKALLLNARSESVAAKPSFRGAFRKRRCLVPADGFFEWLPVGGRKQPYLFRLWDGGPFAFAGLWDRWEGPNGPLSSCAVITAGANELVGRVHDRMPVILGPADFGRWLDPQSQDAEALLPLLKPYPADRMAAVAVNPCVNSARYDGPDCVEPAA
jgi:putative SOS response-associated peptidase YedK